MNYNLFKNFLSKALSYFKPNITISNLSLTNSTKIIINSLFNNPLFLEQYLSVVDELTFVENNAKNKQSIIDFKTTKSLL